MIYQCERCGGSCVQEAGMYNLATKKYDAPAGKCDGCAGHGFLLPNNSIAELVRMFNQLERDNRDTPPATPPALRPEVADAIRRISILCPDNAGLFNPSPMFDGCKVCLKPECLHEPPPDAGIIVAELERLAAENAGLKAELVTLRSQLSRIDYAFGEPNEFGASPYDVDLDGERVVRQVEAMVAAREWLPIADAPKDGTPVLMLRKDGDIKEARWKETWLDDRGGILHVAAWGGNGWWFPEWDQPTHWMPKPPLPEPPTEDAGS